MSELNERRWAVLSERGCEATDLTYLEAARLMREFARKRVSGLSVITSDAARRISRTENPQSRQSKSQYRLR